MSEYRMTIDSGVAALIANAHNPAPKCKVYYFDKGDLCQMASAAKVAVEEFGFEVGVAGGYPYVMSEEEYNKVVEYIINNQINGYHHYKSD